MVWKQVPGAAQDIGIGSDDSVWITGGEEREDGFAVYRWTGLGWAEAGGTGVEIAVTPEGQPWTVDRTGRIARCADGGWETLPGRARDIGIGADGSVWIIAAEDLAEGFNLQRWTGQGWQPDGEIGFDPLPDGTGGVQVARGLAWINEDGASPVAGRHARRIAVESDGRPWVVDDQGDVHRRVHGGWLRLPHAEATDIGISAHGCVWIVGSDPRKGGYGIYRWYHGTDWDTLDGAGRRISVLSDGLTWICNDAGDIFRRHVKC
ncbi:hypothetical protein [Poseidonocella sp. HB161398]|uniref:hypothetical protein n=1 Tax=Poseidonocella sp. HB161398 TaxID=2320855 RepID=UPI0011083C4F|nr:hypothetical protein [Poseidonocella sp. HB161398]